MNNLNNFFKKLKKINHHYLILKPTVLKNTLIKLKIMIKFKLKMISNYFGINISRLLVKKRLFSKINSLKNIVLKMIIDFMLKKIEYFLHLLKILNKIIKNFYLLSRILYKKKFKVLTVCVKNLKIFLSIKIVIKF